MDIEKAEKLGELVNVKNELLNDLKVINSKFIYVAIVETYPGLVDVRDHIMNYRISNVGKDVINDCKKYIIDTITEKIQLVDNEINEL